MGRVSDSLEVLSYRELVRAYGLLDQGELVGGEFCFTTPIGLAKPSIWRGDPAFLERLGDLLLESTGKLGKLSLSRLLPTVDKTYSFQADGAAVILSTWETGPSCDTHNGFELFTILAGVAHWHQLTSRPGNRFLVKWRQQYQQLLDSLSSIQHPALNKRALSYWEGLVDMWRNCLRQGLAILDEIDPEQLQSCLALGVHGFDDFVYLADVHRVHFNPVYRSHWNLPAVDLTALIECCEGDLRIAANMLLSYTKVRALNDAEKKLILADLWYPRGLTVEELLFPGMSILAIRRLQAALEQRMVLIADLEELLSPEAEAMGQLQLSPAPADGARQPQVRATMPDELEELTPTVAPELEAQSVQEVKTMSEEKGKELLEQVESEETVEMEEQSSVPETEQELTEMRPAKKVLVWKPFPRPLNAQEEEKIEVEEEAVEQPDPQDEEEHEH